MLVTHMEDIMPVKNSEFVPMGDAIIQSVQALKLVGLPAHIVEDELVHQFCESYKEVSGFDSEFLRRYVRRQLLD